MIDAHFICPTQLILLTFLQNIIVSVQKYKANHFCKLSQTRVCVKICCFFDNSISYFIA